MSGYRLIALIHVMMKSTGSRNDFVGFHARGVTAVEHAFELILLASSKRRFFVETMPSSNWPYETNVLKQCHHMRSTLTQTKYANAEQINSSSL